MYYVRIKQIYICRLVNLIKNEIFMKLFYNNILINKTYYPCNSILKNTTTVNC